MRSSHFPLSIYTHWYWPIFIMWGLLIFIELIFLNTGKNCSTNYVTTEMLTEFYLFAISFMAAVVFNSELVNFIFNSLVANNAKKSTQMKLPSSCLPCNSSGNRKQNLFKMNSGITPSLLKLGRKFGLGNECTFLQRQQVILVSSGWTNE